MAGNRQSSKQLSEQQQNRIKKLHESEGLGASQIAKRIQCNRNTVAKYLPKPKR